MTFSATSTLEACRSLLAARRRSILALVGIVVGVAAVSAMTSVGLVVKAHALEQFREIGTEVMTVRVRDRDKSQGRVNLTVDEARNVASVPAVLSAAPYRTTTILPQATVTVRSPEELIAGMHRQWWSRRSGRGGGSPVRTGSLKSARRRSNARSGSSK